MEYLRLLLNVLYIWEDMGFGSYSEESFVEPYQWIPARFLYKENTYNEIIELNKQRILEKQFKFVITEYEKSNKQNKLKEVVSILTPYLEDNYTSIIIETQNGKNLILYFG